MKKYYDMVIIGAGPAGLALAHCCTRMGINILVIDKESTIGGCHRVIRTKEGLFTEHSPRIYLTNYVNVLYLISEMGLKQDDIFVNYKYSVLDIVLKLIPYITLYDIMVFIYIYLIYLINSEYGHNISLKNFCKYFGVSDALTEKLDRLCRLVDGAGIDKYSMNQFLNLSDARGNILQPSQPLDKSLFKVWKQYLGGRNVDFALGQQVSYIHYNKNLKKIDYIVINNKYTIHLNRLIFAIPPASMTNLLKNNVDIKNAFGQFDAFDEWSEKTEYIEYISMTFHFKDKVDIPTINGATLDTDWGIVVIALSDYMQNIEEGYLTLLSIGISMSENPSKYTGKTANQSTTEEIFAEVYRQLRESLYAELPDDYHAVLNPTNYYKNNKWNSRDEAYFHTVGTAFLPYKSKTIQNLYNVGTHNGNSHMAYTTMESAVSNAMVLSSELYPQLRTYYYLRKGTTNRELIVYAFIIIFLIFLIMYLITYIYSKYKN